MEWQSRLRGNAGRFIFGDRIGYFEPRAAI
jgi:hypothetical protein